MDRAATTDSRARHGAPRRRRPTVDESRGTGLVVVTFDESIVVIAAGGRPG